MNNYSKQTERSQNGYNLFFRDHQKYVKEDDIVVSKKRGSVNLIINRSILSHSLDDADKQWENLQSNVKDEYRARLETEKHIKSYLRDSTSGKGDYAPISDYGKYIKKEIESGKVKKCNSRFFYEVFQKWLKEKKHGSKAGKNK